MPALCLAQRQGLSRMGVQTGSQLPGILEHSQEATVSSSGVSEAWVGILAPGATTAGPCVALGHCFLICTIVWSKKLPLRPAVCIPGGTTQVNLRTS